MVLAPGLGPSGLSPDLENCQILVHESEDPHAHVVPYPPPTLGRFEVDGNKSSGNKHQSQYYKIYKLNGSNAEMITIINNNHGDKDDHDFSSLVYRSNFLILTATLGTMMLMIY